jgi:predicted nucleic acid-binding protein
MIVVDTTIWVDFLNGRRQAHVEKLAELIDADAGIALTDLILTEVSQGIRDERQVRLVDERLCAFDVFRLESLDDFRRAAHLYRTARRHGVTIQRTIDCLIASVCIREELPIMHNDADFDRLAEHSELIIHQISDVWTSGVKQRPLSGAL